MTDVDRVRLLHVLDASRKAAALVTGVSLEQYAAEENYVLRAATERFVSIIGEAARHVSDESKSQFPDIPWREIAGMRNHLVHGNTTTANEYVWKAAVEDAPRIVAELATLQRNRAPALHPHPSPLPAGEGTELELGGPRKPSGSGAGPPGSTGGMTPTREYVLAELLKVRETLRSFGVRRIGVFGSVARNAARADSDIDIIVDFPRGQITLSSFFGLQDFLSDHFQRKVDVITENGLKPYARDLVMRDAVFLDGLHEPEPEAEESLARA